MYNGDLLNQGGILAPKASAIGTKVDGDYTQQAAATIEIELAGLDRGTLFDFVNVSGTATLAAL